MRHLSIIVNDLDIKWYIHAMNVYYVPVNLQSKESQMRWNRFLYSN